LEAAEIHLTHAHDLMRDCGAFSEMFAVTISMGDVERMRGNLERAEDLYRKAAHYFETTGDRGAAVTYLNLALVRLEADDAKGTRRWLGYAALALERHPQEQLRGGVHILELACDAAEREWRSWDENLDAIPKWIARTGVLELDDAVAMERAAELTLRAGDYTRAARAFELSEELWRQIGDDDAVERARKARDAL